MPAAPRQPLDRIASAASRALARAGRPRLKPRVTVLCMAFDQPRQARVELRIVGPAGARGWTIRRIEPRTPAIVGIARRADELSQSTLDVALSPRPDGPWFDGDPTFWLRYAAGAVPVHRVSLRLLLEDVDGRRRALVVSAVFPAMTWTATTPPRAQKRPAVHVRPAPRRRPLPVEARHWSDSGVAGPG